MAILIGSRFHSYLVALAAALLFSMLANETRAGWAGKEVYGIAPDGTELQWVVYTPTGRGPWPAVLVIHGGGFKGGGPASCAIAALDLADAGYIAYAIEYRLAPNGLIAGQVSDGRFPQQSDDVKMAVRAARADPRGNGQVGAVGGSAGGYHTAFVAATGAYGDDRIDVGVSLSGGDAELLDITEEALDRCVAINLKSCIFAAKHVIPIMRAQKSGVIINISSMAVITTYPYVAYKATKAAMVSFTEQLAYQNAAYGIRANVILPGLMNTPMAVDTRAREFNKSRAEVEAERA
jgi:NAD(P)-dependent dehydrogenase (short-subunit alcohol dehydrogenase family)